MSTVLIVEDEPKIRAVLRDALHKDADKFLEASNGAAAIAMAETGKPDLVILDLGLPDMDGSTVCAAIRSWSGAPILVLSARADEQEKARLLEAGADDYVTKPFSTVELRARVRALMRRARMKAVAEAEGPLVIGRLVIDTALRIVTRDGQPVRLTPTEWALLRVLVMNAGRPVTHQQLFRAVWGNSSGDVQLYVRVYVAHLRKKLESDSLRPELIVTEPGVGYRFGGSG
ncbi:MAG: response regulator transcription factor [Gemmatimonadota bacterium]|nr:response regulator transcription factor [Gemmatimonadota bacterium]